MRDKSGIRNIPLLDFELDIVGGKNIVFIFIDGKKKNIVNNFG